MLFGFYVSANGIFSLDNQIEASNFYYCTSVHISYTLPRNLFLWEIIIRPHEGTNNYSVDLFQLSKMDTLEWTTRSILLEITS